MIPQWFGRLLATASIGIFAAGTAAEGLPGVLWQTTSQMVMPGLPFSPQPNTSQRCTAGEWTQPPPPPPGQTCTNSNFQRQGNKVTWDTQCTGEMDMAGRGEITFTSPDAYTGVINLTARGMTVTVNLSGTKLGDCDNPID